MVHHPTHSSKHGTPHQIHLQVEITMTASVFYWLVWLSGCLTPTLIKQWRPGVSPHIQLTLSHTIHEADARRGNHHLARHLPEVSGRHPCCWTLFRSKTFPWGDTHVSLFPDCVWLDTSNVNKDINIPVLSCKLSLVSCSRNVRG